MARPNRRPLLSFVTCVLGIIVTWTVILPWVSSRPAVHQRLEFLDRRGIDPSAMYYTELDVMDDILDRLEGRPYRDAKQQ
ncbi:hypothetical protein Pla22_47970 [Rubripirellula amarantea]|uniref:Uncharacterized protein n=1 Tax=Rubripirellula amarantea TaxID=2527999 RepID=A0A5C5WG28_9BACT|nr:hypothetical protein [Rubripirellula amarantea]TWT49600.1 hypothetical protein Pla22_47970 [Rubripirellula amarantea]